jgi:hypothetical protein
VIAVTLVRLRELPGAQDVQLNDITRPQPTTGSAGTTSGSGSSSSGGSDCGQIHGVSAAKWDATVTFDAAASSSATDVPRSLGGGS